jgi:transposase
LGRSRGGFGTKIHLAVDCSGVPLGVTLTPGQAADSPSCDRLLESVRLPKARGGRPRTKPRVVVGDKGYNSGRLRAWMRSRRIRPVIPTFCNQPSESSFDRSLYRERNVVERVVGWLKEHRRIGTRSEKLAVRFLSMVKLAIIQRLFRQLEEPSNRT